MTLKKLTVPLTFVAGVDTSADAKITGQSLLRAENAIFPRKGAVAKRHGTKQLAGTHTEPHLAAFRDRPVLVDDDIQVADGADITAATFNAADDVNLWQVRSERAETPVGEQRFNAEVVDADQIRVWSYAIAAAGGLYDLHIETYERYSGRQLATLTIPNPSGGNNPQCRLVVLNNAIHYLYVSGLVLWRGVINQASGAIGAAAATVIAFANNQPFDAMAINDTTIISCGRAPTNEVRMGSCNVVTGANFGPLIVGSANATVVGLWNSFGTVVVGWWETVSRNLRFAQFDDVLIQTGANVNIRTLNAGESVLNISGVTLAADSTVGYLLYSFDTASIQPQVWLATLDLATPAVTSDVRQQAKSLLAAKPFESSARFYYWVTMDSTRCAYLYDGVNNIPAGKLAPATIEPHGTADPVATNWVAACSLASPWTTVLRYYIDDETAAPAAVLMTRPAVLRTEELQDDLVVPGSLQQLFDGVNCVESGYLHVPEDVSGVVPVGAGNLAAGDYRAVVVYEWRDASNRLHQSSPSNPSAAVTSPGAALITWTLPYLTHTRRDNVRVVLYRTNANGTIYYRHQTWANVKTSDSIAVVDGSLPADNDLSANPQLYISGDVVPNIQPPQGALHCEHQNRHWVVDDERRDTRVRYSKEFAAGIAIEHSSSLYLEVPPDGGDITAVRGFMGRLLVFKAARVYAFAGQPLNSLALGVGMGQPYLISEAIGTEQDKSIIQVPGGLMFRAEDRIWLMDKSLRLQPVGDPVRYQTSQWTISSAVHLPADSLAIWLTSDGDALVYNYLYGLWATWTQHDATDGAVAGGTLFFKRGADDTVRCTDVATYEDPGALVVVLAVETGWLSFAKILGYKRIYRALFGGDNLSAHTLHVEIAYDLEPTWVDDLTFASAGLTAFGEAAQLGDGAVNYQGQGYQIEVRPSRQKCTAIRFRIYDELAAAGQGLSLTALTLVAGIKSGTTARRGTGRRATP